jgi:signal transduction histidine kinase
VVDEDLIKSDKYLKISVIDTGLGIDKANQSKLFKLFGFLEDTAK